MRNLYALDHIDGVDRDKSHAVRLYYGNYGDDKSGIFRVKSPIDGAMLTAVASVGEGWEHVSVSRHKRCPNWPEMTRIKHLFFKDDETVMQLHVPKSDHINCHPNCLHLWRPIDAEIPRPPAWMVGPEESKPTEKPAERPQHERES